jgi:hypothetical protein
MNRLLACLALTLALAPIADAADFTGRIRRIRIREDQNDTSVRTIVATESGQPADFSTLDVAVMDLGSGEVHALSGTPRTTTAHAIARGALPKRPRPLEKVYTITASMRPVGDPTATSFVSFDVRDCGNDCVREQTLENGAVLGVRLRSEVHPDGSEDLTASLRVVRGSSATAGRFDAAEWVIDGFTIGGEDVDGDGIPDASADLDLGEGTVYRTRWATPLWPAATAVEVQATLTNIDGSSDSFTDFQMLDLMGETGLAEAAIRPRNRGGYKLNLWTQATGDVPVGSVFAEVSDSESDEVLAQLDLDSPVETTTIVVATLPSTLTPGERVSAAPVIFDGTAYYDLPPFTFQATPGLVDATFGGEGAVRLFKAAVYEADDGSYELAFSLVGEDAERVESATVSVNARTTAGSVDAAVETRWQRWTGVFTPDAEAETFGLSTQVRDGEGNTVDGWDFDIQARFGFGTRSTASQADGKSELL